MGELTGVVVLAEDRRQMNFALRYLRRSGYWGKRIRPLFLAAGRGSGEKSVRTRYPEAVVDFRTRSSRTNVALVVMIDADNLSVGERAAQLHRELASAGEAPRRDDERVVQLIPKRSIETWILSLVGEDVDEISSYRHRSVEKLTLAAAAAFFNLARENALAALIPSLAHGVNEVRRLR